MSQFILCKGRNREIKVKGINVKQYPFKNKFLSDVTDIIWQDNTKSQIWTIESNVGLDVDFYFTNAQRHINQKGKFQDTELYIILSDILDSCEEVVTWYSSDIEEIPITTDKREFLQIVEEGIRNSFCEVYIKYIKTNINT